MLNKSSIYAVVGSVIILGSLFISGQAQATSLAEALAKAYLRNPELAAMREKQKVVDEDMATAVSGWRPSISADMTRGKTDTRSGVLSNNRVNDSKSLSITQPLFRGGGTIADMKRAKSAIYSNRYALLSTEQDVLLEAVTAYMDIIRDQQVLDLAVSNVSVLEKHLEVTKERFNLGEVTRTDVAQADASLANAISDKIKSQGVLASSRAAYERVIGEKPGVLEEVERPVGIVAPLETIIEFAMDENPLIKAIEFEEKAAKSNVWVEKSKLLPSIDFLASRDKQKGTFSGLDYDSSTLAVNLSIPIYQNGSEYSRVRKAKFNKKKLSYDLIDQRNMVRKDVISAFNDFQVVRVVIESNKAAIEASEISLEGTQQEAKVGARTTLDVLDAEQDLFEAKVRFVRSKRDEIVSSYTLLRHIGRLNVEHLDLDVGVYYPEADYNKRKYKIIGF